MCVIFIVIHLRSLGNNATSITVGSAPRIIINMFLLNSPGATRRASLSINRLFSSPNLEKKLLLRVILVHLTITLALRITHSNDSK